MNATAENTKLFEQHRRELERFAYRMTGTLADAQDLVQDTYVKWRTVDAASVGDVRSWLLTVCSRLAINRWKSARQRRESYVGVWLPEPLVDDSVADPSRQAEVDDSVSVAFMLALEVLSAPERAVFLLYEVFDYSFAEIAKILDRTEPACRQLASRARTRLREARPSFRSTTDEHQRLLDAFFRAARGGDVTALQDLLASDAELHADSGGRASTAPGVLCGPVAIAEFITRVWTTPESLAAKIEVGRRTVNGVPALLVWQGARLIVALSFACEDGKVHRVFAHRNPEKLAVLEAGLS